MHAMAVPALAKIPFLLIPLALVLMENKGLANFVLEYEIISISTHVHNCGGDESTSECETFLSDFCLREGRNTLSNDTSDCPLGFGSAVYYGENFPIMREIMSEESWTVSTYTSYLSDRATMGICN